MEGDCRPTITSHVKPHTLHDLTTKTFPMVSFEVMNRSHPQIGQNSFDVRFIVTLPYVEVQPRIVDPRFRIRRFNHLVPRDWRFLSRIRKLRSRTWHNQEQSCLGILCLKHSPAVILVAGFAAGSTKTHRLFAASDQLRSSFHRLHTCITRIRSGSATMGIVTVVRFHLRACGSSMHEFL